MLAPPEHVGVLLRDWRVRRRLSQLDLSGASGVSTRHLSYVETGRSRPSRELVLHLADHLGVPLRDRNRLLVAAGYAPVFFEHPFDDPSRAGVRDAIDRVLRAHEPWPAIVVDRHWNLLTANRAASVLVDGVAPHLVGPPLNVLRVCLHPDGLAPRIANLPATASHILEALRRQLEVLGDPELAALAGELESYPGCASPAAHGGGDGGGGLAVTMRLRHRDRELALISMVATFGTSVDATLSELTLETFLPADDATADVLVELAAARRSRSPNVPQPLAAGRDPAQPA